MNQEILKALAAQRKKTDSFSAQGKRVIGYAAALLLFLVVTNPSVLWFLPEGMKSSLLSIWEQVFGDVGSIREIIRINWVSVFRVVAIILLLLFFNGLVRMILGSLKPKTGKGQSICSMMNSFCSYAAVLIGIVWCLSAIGINLSTIFASLGILTLVIGFAAESLIADIITGIFLVFEDEFSVGDIVEINGFRGTVESIGVRVTCVRDSGGNIKIIKNSETSDILNRSKAASKAVCDIPIGYAADLENAERVLGELLTAIREKYPDVFPKVPEYLGVQALDSSSVNLRICAEVAESQVFKATRLLNREIKLGFDKAEIEIPFQQVVIHQAQG